MKHWQSVNKLLKEPSLRTIIGFVLAWKILLILTSVLAVTYLPLSSQNFLGGGPENYSRNPLFFSWANFDGEHYLSIAEKGYEKLNHSFFPLYPLLMRLAAFGSTDIAILAFVGITISNLSFLVALFLLWKLVSIDFDKKIALLTVLLIILFPTSFYFNAVYTESLFLFLAVATFYCARTGRWWLAVVFGALASASRIVGIMLFPALLLEWWLQSKRKFPFQLLILPIGLLTYMFYLLQSTGSPLTFYNELSIFGVQRQGHLILLPQVFYRYINMLISTNLHNMIYWTISLEFSVAVLSIILLVLGYIKKVRISYLVFAVLAFILPTLTGSFSSLPRYVLVIFPLFIIMAIFLSKKPKFIQLTFCLFMLVLLIIETSLFIRGYWIA